MDTQKEEIEASIRRILEAFALGEQLNLESESGPTRGRTGRLAEKYGILEEQVRKLRVLADKGRGFTREEMDEQFRRFRKEGKSLDLSHFIRSLALPRGRIRNSALRAALAKGLSSHQLQSLISTRQPNSKQAGRKPKPLVSDQFDQMVGRLVWSWDRILDANLEVNRFSNPDLEKAVQKMQRMMKVVIMMSSSSDS